MGIVTSLSTLVTKPLSVDARTTKPCTSSIAKPSKFVGFDPAQCAAAHRLAISGCYVLPEDPSLVVAAPLP